MVVGNAFNIVILFLMNDYFTMCMPYLSKPNHKFLEFIQPPNLKKKHTLSQNLIIQPWALPNFTNIIVIVQNQIKNCN